MWLQTLAPQSFGNHSLQLHCVRLQVHSIFTYKPITVWTLQFIDNMKQTKRLTHLPKHAGRQFSLGISASLPSDQRSDRNRTVVQVQESKNHLPAQLELCTRLQPALTLVKRTDRSLQSFPSREEGQQHWHQNFAVPAGPVYRAAHRKESRTSTAFPKTCICIKE